MPEKSERLANLSHTALRSFYSQLCRLVEEENQALYRLEENLKQQYSCLMQNDFPRFLQVLEEQRALVWEMSQKEQLRMESLKKYLPNPEEHSLSQIITWAPEEYRDPLMRLKREFEQRMNEIRVMQERNRILIQKSLELVQKQIHAIRTLIQDDAYDENGELKSNDISIINTQV
jgi:flagellar biosynthesis/type III secretory pathway chaperone